jgi:predicted hotdog family 3-hydroxylacyl-ACP dehydratase
MSSASFALTVPEHLFAGHFPGRPILPGVAQLALALEHLAPSAPLASISFLRLREIVRPGDQLSFKVRSTPEGPVRIDLKHAETLVSNAQLVFGPLQPLPASDNSLITLPGRPERSVSLDDLLPHRAPMRFVSAVLDEHAAGLVCAASVPASCPLADDGTAPAFVVLEAAAQAAALWEALRRWRGAGTASAHIGYLVAARDIALGVERVPVARTLIASAYLAAAMLPLTHYDIEVALDTVTVLRGRIATYITDQLIA